MEHLLPYLILAASLIANLFLFYSLKRELHAHSVKQGKLASRLKTAEEREALLLEASAEAAGPPPRSGFNLNRRVQAMRLFRQGEPPDHIAALLGVPCKEVELLIRVRRMVEQQTTLAPR